MLAAGRDEVIRAPVSLLEAVTRKRSILEHSTRPPFIDGKLNSMALHPLSRPIAPPGMLANVPKLVTAYYTEKPDASVAAQKVSFGTSGHRGSSFHSSFNEGHILAITQAICQYRQKNGVDGPLFLAKDTHGLSEPAFASALEVLAANGVEAMVDQDLGYTPTPTLSHAILTYNRGRKEALADGIVITPSHNPPEDGGFKYNPPSGGPADTDATKWIENRANQILRDGLRDDPPAVVRSAPLAAATTHRHDYISNYVNDLASAVDLDAVRDARLSIGADPLGGAGIAYWDRIADRYEALDEHCPQPCGPHLSLHVGRLGRQDPHGLFVALCHGGVDRDEGHLRYRLRLRYGS